MPITPTYIVEYPTAEQFVEYSRGMKRVSYITVQDTAVASAFITKVADDGHYMKVKAGFKNYAIHPHNLKEISFYSK